jgi:hypothetical protein
MSSSIGSTRFDSLSPNQLSSALIQAITAQVPDGSTATFRYGANDQTGSASPASIVSFSPEANAALTRDQIALQLMNRDSSYRPAQRQVSAASTSANAATDKLATTAPSDSSTALLDQYRQMSVTDRFYATTNAKDMDFGMTPGRKAAFDAAFNSRTLNIQGAANVPLLDDKETWTVSKADGGGMGSTGSFSGAYQPPPGQQATVFGTIFGGDMLISWGSQPGTNIAAAAETPPVANSTASAS